MGDWLSGNSTFPVNSSAPRTVFLDGAPLGNILQRSAVHDFLELFSMATSQPVKVSRPRGDVAMLRNDPIASSAASLRGDHQATFSRFYSVYLAWRRRTAL